MVTISLIYCCAVIAELFGFWVSEVNITQYYERYEPEKNSSLLQYRAAEVTSFQIVSLPAVTTNLTHVGFIDDSPPGHCTWVYKSIFKSTWTIA